MVARDYIDAFILDSYDDHQMPKIKSLRTVILLSAQSVELWIVSESIKLKIKSRVFRREIRSFTCVVS